MKKTLALLLTLVIAFGLAACGGQKPAPDAINNTPSPVNITLWTYPVGNWGNATTVASVIADFSRKYPNINLSVDFLSYSDGDDKIEDAIASKSTPDLVLEGPERLSANWGARGLMVDLSDLPFDRVQDSVLSACRSPEDAYYTYPICMTAHCMAINYDLFKAADALQYIDTENHTWTTENFISAVQALDAYGVSNIAAIYCGGQGGDQGTRALINNLYGGAFTTPEHDHYTVHTEPNIRALTLLRSLPGFQFDAAMVGENEVEQFCRGELAMAFCWNAAIAINHTVNNPDLQFKIFPMAFPSPSGTPQLVGGIWGFGIFDNGDPAKIDAAKTFIRFIAENNAQYTRAVQIANYWPVMRDMENIYVNDTLMTEYGAFMPFMGDYYQVTPGWAQARTAWWHMLQQIGTGTDISTATAAFDATANAAIGP